MQGTIKEIWKNVSELPEYYQVSNFGRVRSKDRESRNGNGKYLRKGKILKLTINNKGYLYIQMKAHGNTYKRYVHRLVGKEFIPNPHKKPYINHIDCNPKNNKLNNLEWCTPKENQQHMYKLGRSNRGEEWLRKKREFTETLKKPVVRIHPITKKRKVYSYLTEVRKDGFNAGNVCYACQGKIKTSKGFIWEYL